MRSKRVGLDVALVIVALAALVTVTTGSAAHDAKAGADQGRLDLRRPAHDGGTSQAHDRGRLAVQKALGAKVVTTYKENVPEGPQAAQVIDSLVRDGNKIIFATSFGYMDAMAAAAKKFGRLLRACDGLQVREELRQLLRRRRRTRSTSPGSRRSRDEEGRRRVHRAVPDPRDHPARECICARSAGQSARTRR